MPMFKVDISKQDAQSFFSTMWFITRFGGSKILAEVYTFINVILPLLYARVDSSQEGLAVPGLMAPYKNAVVIPTISCLFAVNIVAGGLVIQIQAMGLEEAQALTLVLPYMFVVLAIEVNFGIASMVTLFGEPPSSRFRSGLAGVVATTRISMIIPSIAVAYPNFLCRNFDGYSDIYIVYKGI